MTHEFRAATKLLRSTPPSREATRSRAMPCGTSRCGLRSTPPSREATSDCAAAFKECAKSVAIHAPLAGGDQSRAPWSAGRPRQVAIHAPLAGGDNSEQLASLASRRRSCDPRPPRGRRPRQRSVGTPDAVAVAIHAPLAGGDLRSAYVATRASFEKVAIHAPLAGGDPDRSNVVARRTIEGEVREPRRPPAWRVYRSSQADP